jgi:hypothetical protein
MAPEFKKLPLGVALGFYDGVTEGFASDLLDGMPCYFDLVAWDSGQDERLFVAVKVDPSLYARFVSSLRQSGDAPIETMWLSKWEFSKPADEAEADGLLRSCRSRLSQEGVLLLTARIGIDLLRVFAMSTELKLMVERVLARGSPDDLELWARHLRA